MRHSIACLKIQPVNWGGGIQIWVFLIPKTKPSLSQGLEIAADMDMSHSDPVSRKYCSAVSSVWLAGSTALRAPAGSGSVSGVLVMFNNGFLGLRSVCKDKFSSCYSQ